VSFVVDALQNSRFPRLGSDLYLTIMSTATQTHEYTRTAIVTGAAQGIGRGISLRLAADGLDVAVADLPGQIDALNAVVAEIQQLGRKAVAVIADVSKEDEVKALVETTVSSLGRLDVVSHA
jgi:NAD(P)-dependent dehydrogenase (short-subunit alcohol dehydrogenase family)